MKKQNDNDVVRILEKVNQVIGHKPTPEKMLEEVMMMKFKIRPLQGDVSLLDLQDRNLIEVLWGLGKLDEIFYQELQKVSPQKKPLLFKIFENFNQKFQEKLSQVNLTKEKPIDHPRVLEMEIIKERSLKKSN